MQWRVEEAFFYPSLLICWPRYSSSISTFIFLPAPSSFPTLLLSRKQQPKPYCKPCASPSSPLDVPRGNLVLRLMNERCVQEPWECKSFLRLSWLPFSLNTRRTISHLLLSLLFYSSCPPGPRFILPATIPTQASPMTPPQRCVGESCSTPGPHCSDGNIF